MATIYVSDTSGNDGNDGSEGSPKATIQAGVNAADDSSPAVVIILDSATYSEQVNVGTDSGFTPQNITIKGADGQLPVLDGAGGTSGGISGFQARDGSTRTVTVQNIKFTRHGGSNGGVFKGNGGSFLGLAFAATDCEFNANTSAIFNRTGGNSGAPSSANRCKFTENTANLVRQQSGAGDMFVNFTNCVFGIKASTEGLDFESGKDNGTVKNCSFVADLSSTNHIVRAGVVENTVVQNLSTTSGGSQTSVGIEANSSRSNNCTFGNFGTAQTGGTDGGNNLTGQDPLFTDTTLSNPDLQISSASPCRDAGKTIEAITTDFAGVSRPQGAAYDIGAFEFVFWMNDDGQEGGERKFGPNSFSLRTTKKKLATRTFAVAGLNRQAPFFVSMPGPPTIRKRTDPYKNET